MASRMQKARAVHLRQLHEGPPLLVRRSLSDPKQLAYYLADAPARRSFDTLIWVASSRYTIEQCIEEAKGETGLDQYEVRLAEVHLHVTGTVEHHLR